MHARAHADACTVGLTSIVQLPSSGRVMSHNSALEFAASSSSISMPSPATTASDATRELYVTRATTALSARPFAIELAMSCGVVSHA